MKKQLLFLSTILLLAVNSSAQNVNIPDTVFKAYLVGNSAINTNLDSEIQVSEASAFNGNIQANSIGITDMTGIEAFTALTFLSVSGNSFTSIDLTNCPDIYHLDLGSNGLTQLDLSNNSKVRNLYISYNNLTSLDLSNVDSLRLLSARGNDITSLNFSNNTKVQTIYCNYNNLNYLNLKNGNNTNISFMRADNNPNLTCILVDDTAYANANWPYIDAQSFFAINCPTTSIITEGVNKVTLFPNPTQSHVTIQLENGKVANYQLYNNTGKLIQSINQTNNIINLEGLEKGIYFIAIEDEFGNHFKKKVLKL